MAIAEDFNHKDYAAMIDDIEMLGESPSVKQLQLTCKIYPQFSLWLMIANQQQNLTAAKMQQCNVI